MAFIPHTEQDIRAMLERIGVKNIEDLFDEIPTNLLAKALDSKVIPSTISEMAATQEFNELADQDRAGPCFIGAGAYEHFIPAAVWELVSRGEFLTAYTPYQPEASQGTLQVIYEYQTMMAGLMGLEVANASLYDGATALAEAVLMAVRANRHSRSKRVLLPQTVHPFYRDAVRTIVSQQGIELKEIPYNSQTGQIDFDALEKERGQDITAMVIPQPNFFGVLEDVDALTDWAHEHNALVIAVVNPTAMALLKEPGSWGTRGVDIACGEGQSLGVPLASGGPYFGFMACRQEFIRQMPGRLVGRTVDLEGRPGFVLTLQAREQHIRRSKATSNICTNQGLLMLAATIYMSLMGPEGLRRVALKSCNQTHKLIESLQEVSQVSVLFKASPLFHEFVLKLPMSSETFLHKMAAHGIQAGFDIKPYYSDMGDAVLVCVTETKSEVDLQKFIAALKEILEGKAKETATKAKEVMA